jgi:uncharacterized protein YcbX
MRLSSIHTYPVKGCHRIDRESAVVQPWGLAGDRRWLIADDEGRTLTQRDEPAVTRISRPLWTVRSCCAPSAGRT